MKFLKKINLSIAVVLIMAMLFSCEKEQVYTDKLYDENQDIPLSETYDFHLVYTLNGDQVMVLISPLMQDFSKNKDFQFQYFPKKIKVILTNKKGEVTTIFADKAYIYKNPTLIELLGNVKIINNQGASIETEQLFWDEKNQHIFGETHTILRHNDEVISGLGFDSSLDFKNVRINQVSGRLKLKNQ